MVNLVTLGFFCTGFLRSLVSPEEQQVEVKHSRLCPWECMTFVQMWPGSFCVALGRKFECVMPKNANNWTIHGLWPSDVMECCTYWRLFPSDLVDLMPELNVHWPTLINISNFRFWEKEWQKHGTCAGCIETLNCPNKYFRAALFLRTKYNIDRAFQTAAVVPSCRWNYQLKTFMGVLQPILGDQYELQCVTDVQGRQILVQIKVSLHSDFSTGCIEASSYDISPYKPCTAEERIFYFPANQENPHNPCP
ncbi:ribonuclease Oy-like [Elgaria multicarinata webbii]|uniref:ribonuclease Oy-like n=1 Tax=Elgaria multicarinata webbii TaxID=159646 RepID=UPI002FCCF073